MKEPPIERAIYAVVWDRLDILKTIVTKYPEVLTQKNSHGTTLLHASASELSTLEYLLSFKLVNVNAINDSNYTPLQISLLTQNIENAKLLVKNGATMDSISENGKTALSALSYLVKKQGYSAQDANQLLNELK
jgi:ankyrin repeat protein